MAGLDTIETGNELFQPTFQFISMVNKDINVLSQEVFLSNMHHNFYFLNYINLSNYYYPLSLCESFLGLRALLCIFWPLDYTLII